MSNFQLYHGKNKVYSNEIMMTITALYYIPTLLYLYSDGGCTQCLLIVVFVPADLITMGKVNQNNLQYCSIGGSVLTIDQVFYFSFL